MNPMLYSTNFKKKNASFIILSNQLFYLINLTR